MFAPPSSFATSSRPRGFIVLVIADHGLIDDFKVCQQFAGLPGVFAGDQIGFAQHAQGAQRDVFQIADGRRDKVERSRHRSTMKP